MMALLLINWKLVYSCLLFLLNTCVYSSKFLFANQPELICISPDLHCNVMGNACVQFFLSEFTFEFTRKEGHLLLHLALRVTFVTVWPVYLIYKLSVFPSHELLKYEVFSHLLLASFCQCGKKPNSDKIMPEQKRYNEEYFLPGYLMECPHPCMAVPSSCLLSLNMSKNNQRDDREDQRLCPQICSSLRVWTFFFFFAQGSFTVAIAYGSCLPIWQ